MTYDYRHTGRISIDLALTGGEGPAFTRFEVIPTPADLDAWLAQSDLAIPRARAAEDDLVAARALRWAIWHAVSATIDGEPLRPADVRAIEDAAAPAPLLPRVAGGWRDPSARAALSTIARDAIDLLADPEQRGRLRRCAADNCIVPFYDGSRPGRRRWCEDRRCGDRHRHRTHRQRQREPA